jgi:SNF2 family DNA or RNA helicase
VPDRRKQEERRRKLKLRAAAEREEFDRREGKYLAQEARRAFRAGDAPAAARLANRALLLFPDHLPALELLAHIHLAAEHYGDALYYFRQMRKRSDDARLIYNSGVACMRMGRREDALAEFGAFLEAVPPMPPKELYELRESARKYCQQLSQEPTPAPVKQQPAVPPPKEPPAAPAAQHRVDVVFLPSAAPVLHEQKPGTLLDHFLRRRLLELRLAQSFEDLICLPSLHGVDSYVYQHETVRRVLRHFKGRALLADEVGLGKTIEACLVLKEYWLRGMARKALILVPPSLVPQWKGELSEKFGFTPVSPDGSDFRQNPERFWRENPLVVASIALARLDPHASLLAAIPWDMVIVDEAHCLKNRASSNWKLVNSLQKRFILMLTATPVENSLVELYNLITVLKPGLLSTESEFRRQFIVASRPNSPKNPEKLRELLAEVMIRNTRAAVDVRLPPRLAASVVVPPSPAEAEMYRLASSFVARRYRQEVTARRSDMALGWLLRQAGSSPQALARSIARTVAEPNGLDAGSRRELEEMLEVASQVDSSGKGEQLARLLRGRPGKVVVFTEFLATIEHLAQICERDAIPYAVFQGDLSRAEKDAAIARFRDEAGVLLSTGVGGEGRNLQFANTVMNFDLPWNPMRLEQRVGRVHRIGQAQEVYVFNFCQAGTIEEQVLRVLHDKINMFELVVGEIDALLGSLEDDRDFSELVLDLWLANHGTGREAQAFDELADRLLDAKRQYARTKELDEALFHRDFEA